MTPEERASRLNTFLRINNGTGNYIPGTQLSGNYFNVPLELTEGIPYVIADGVFFQRSTFNNLIGQQQPGYTGSKDITPAELNARNAAAQASFISQGMRNIGTEDKPLYVPIGSPADTLQSNISRRELPFGLSQEDLKNPAVQISLQQQGYDVNGRKLGAQEPQMPQAPQVNQSGWTEAQKQVFQLYKDFFDKQAAIGKRVNPNITIDDSIIQKFKDIAKADAEPYYKQLFDQAEQDLKLAFQRTGQDYESEKRKLELSYGQNLEAAQGSFARRGLEFSSDRARAEQNLASQARSGLSALQIAGQRAYENVGLEAERNIGSSLFPNISSNVSTYEPSLGRPGVYGFQQTGTRSLFNPVGNVTGELQRKQLFDIENRTKDMTEAERQYRASQYL